MKKIIKFSEVVLTALLMVGPIVPQVIPTVEVRADSEGQQPIDASRLQAIANEFKSMSIRKSFYSDFSNENNANLLDDMNDDEDPVPGIDKFLGQGYFLFDYDFFKKYMSQELPDSDSDYLKNNEVSIGLQIYNSNGERIKTMKDFQNLGVGSYTMNISIFYLDGETMDNVSGSTGLRLNILDGETTSANFSYKSKITVTDGTPISSIDDPKKYVDPKLTDTGSDGNNRTIYVSYFNNIYDKPEFYRKALYARLKRPNFSKLFMNINPELFDNNGNPLPTDDFEHLEGDTFKTGTYYRLMPLDFGDSDKDAKDTEGYKLFSNKMNSMSSDSGSSTDKDNLNLKINGKSLDDSIKNYSFDLPIVNTIYVVQEIDVVPNKPVDDGISGIVTTHKDAKYYALYNDDNNKVSHRSLMANSSWKTDKIRTINGVKQYRVSSHEWVNASDVDFISNGEITESMTIQNLDTPKEISLAKNHKVYALQNSKKEVSKVRALSGGTNWKVDKIGTDMHGGVYYGVSTDEFVKADDGVNVVK
ncbi:hypothetical protein FC72_GL001782 [Companilactobacillus tucceti DSM 20183]|uniref:Uncharacterized protein n=1 Tax=Companilactobacillus tucceti DSM 20183 TaxID=1423811 RepID=A0A0R1J9Q0_9LACO|nr:SLAP domain-containing protein [Companilactobacillus tucceti]KRK64932.1 hypothetical protein FC72_GL001782 [Companilactobacillus tucceti DSM 20183]